MIMKTKKLFFLFSILFSMLATNASAYDFEVKNAEGVMIYYNYINKKNEAEVTYKTKDYNSYSGSIAIPKEVTYEGRTLKVTGIDVRAFYNCKNLTSVTIPNSMTSIGNYAFWDCSSLTSVTIPNSVTSIGKQAFRGCSALTSIIVGKKNSKYDSRDNCNAIIETNSNALILGCKNTVIPNNVTSIGDEAFSLMKGLQNITIPNSVTSIGKFAFSQCISLQTVTIPNSVTSIGDDAFLYCSSLKSVTIPNNVTSIGEQAFNNCGNTTKVTSKIAKPFAIIDNTFYSKTYSIATLYVPKGTVAQYKATDGWKNFKNIVEEGTSTGIDDIEADNTLNTANAIYDTNSKRLPATSLDELPSGLYIINGKKVVVK